MRSLLIVSLAAGAALLAQEALAQDIRPRILIDGQEVQGSPAVAVRAAPGVQLGEGAIRFLGAQPIGGEPVKGAPYSAEGVTESTQVLADGNRIVQHRSSMQYRDGLGRERREETLGGAKMVIVSDPVANTNFTLNSQERTVRMMGGLVSGNGAVRLEIRSSSGAGPANAGTIAVSSGMILPGQPPSAAVATEPLGSQTIEGIVAEGTRQTHTIPAGQIGNQQPIQIVDEKWFSPELRIPVMTRHSDPREGETVFKLTNIVRTEPDPSLFQVPPDYKIKE
jgi:hypothetical protein